MSMLRERAELPRLPRSFISGQQRLGLGMFPNVASSWDGAFFDANFRYWVYWFVPGNQ